VPSSHPRLKEGGRETWLRTLTKGTPGEMTKYLFNKMGWKFGTGKMPDGKTMFAINVRCLEGVDMTTLRPRPVDGRRS
jgi:hypothetical protein